MKMLFNNGLRDHSLTTWTTICHMIDLNAQLKLP